MGNVMLPLDIIDMIIDWYVYLESTGDDVERAQFAPRLKALSLVSRSWLAPCQRVLFQRIRLGLPPDCEHEDDLQVPRFLFLLLHPHLARYVVCVCIWSDSMPADAAELLRCMPAAFPNLEQLEVEAVWRDPPLEFMTRMPATLGRFARLESLALVCMREAVIDPWRTCLASLQLHNVDIIAPAELLLPLVRAVVMPRRDAVQRAVQQGTFMGVSYTTPRQMQELHGFLMQVETWTDLDIMYDGMALDARLPAGECLIPQMGCHPDPNDRHGPVARKAYTPHFARALRVRPPGHGLAAACRPRAGRAARPAPDADRHHV
jgi:hypothetical protein